MNRVLLLGGSGQVGCEVHRIAPEGWEIVRPSSTSVDIRDDTSLHAFVRNTSADVIINCAAFTRVDDAEQESDAAFAINAMAPEILATESARSGAHLLHLSTDYVFGGNAGAPYGMDAATAPASVYGASKLAGERAVVQANPHACVVRTAWVHSGGGVNFIATAVRVLTSGKSMRVVDDQISTPTRALNLAHFLWLLVDHRDVLGVQHFTDAGVASWYDVAHCVLETLQLHGKVGPDASVTPVSTAEFPRPAVRPRVSILDKHATWQRTGYVPIHWRDGVVASTLALIHA